MVKVEFLGPISRETIEIDANSVQEIADHLKDDENLQEWLPKCAVALNDEMISDLTIELKDGDRVTLLPPVCGG
jgi:molybdopterin synthase sulfur carrier subunit